MFDSYVLDLAESKNSLQHPIKKYPIKPQRNPIKVHSIPTKSQFSSIPRESEETILPSSARCEAGRQGDP